MNILKHMVVRKSSLNFHPTFLCCLLSHLYPKLTQQVAFSEPRHPHQSFEMKQTHSHLNEKSDLDAYDNEDHFEDEDYNIPDVNFDDLDLDDAEFGDAEFDDISNQTPELPSARADEQGALERHGDIQGPVTGDTSFILKVWYGKF